MSTEADFRLPRTVIPSRYELTLAPDLEQATFAGHQAVDVEVLQPVRDVVLNAAEITVTDVEMVKVDGRERVVATAIEYDEERERVTFSFDEALVPGKWQLLTSFRGILNDDLRGFYRSTYKDDSGTEHVIATTQFEATDARRAFPCWDEPDLKATFSVALEVAPGLVAVSNAREISAESGDTGNVVHRFAETIKMSTYLVAFVIGEFEIQDPIDVSGVPLRVVHPPGKGHLTEFAREVGAFALDFFADYYEIPYPGDKLDLIAVPDFASGAMENLGAVTFRETALLVDKVRATRGELARVADVIAHEIAHMWFGDLVTMKWWNGLWLNEAFASFMELKCVDAFRPEWNRWLSFAHERAHAMDVDGLESTRPVEYPVASPEEAEGMFDTLTYGKGAAVLRMLERFLGKEIFRRGIAAYLKKHAYDNTDTADLWEALEAASGEPVGEIMSDWIYQGGYPQLDIAKAEGGYRVEQRHFRFLGGGDSRWKVPALYQTDDDSGRLVVEASSFIPTTGDSVLLNVGGDGFYRVNYPEPLLRALAAGLDNLQAPERYTVLADTWANVLAGATEAKDFLNLVGELDSEAEPDVWAAAISGLGELSRVVSSDDRPNLEKLVRDLVSPRVDELGWETSPDDRYQTRRLRALLLRTAGILGDDAAVQATARDVLDSLATDPGAVDGDVADAAVAVVAASGGAPEFDRMLQLRREAASPQDEVRYLRAAAAVPDKETALRLIDMILSGEIRSQDATWLVARLIGHRDTGRAVWERVKGDWEALLAAMPASHKWRMLDWIMYRSEPDIAVDIERWLRDHPIPGAEQITAQQLERLRVRVGLREREAPRLSRALT